MPPKKTTRSRAKASSSKNPNMSMSGGSAVATQTMVTTAVEIGTATLLVITVAVVSFMLGLSLAAAGIIIGQLVKQPTFQYSQFNTEKYEVGRVNLNYVANDTKQQWRRVVFAKPFTSVPVVFTQVVTVAGAQPVHARIRNVNTTGFDIKLEEWAYQDKSHNVEGVHYLAMLQEKTNDYLVGVVETSVDQAPTQSIIYQIDTYLRSSSTPVVISQVQTANDELPLVSRVFHNRTEVNPRYTNHYFNALLVKEQALATSTPVSERVAYLVVRPEISGQALTLNGIERVDVGMLSGVTHSRRTIGFQYFNNQPPFFFAGMSSYNGPDPADVRAFNLSANSADIFIQEEQSADEEVSHTPENVGYLAIFLPRAACGNGTKEAGEQCDDGNLVNGDRCNSFCQIEERCGDGEVQIGEQCDDRNNTSGDGCSATCVIETQPTSTPVTQPIPTSTGTSTGQ